MYAAEKALLAMGVKHPVVGLYSQTDAEKSATLNQKFNDESRRLCWARQNLDVRTTRQRLAEWRRRTDPRGISRCATKEQRLNVSA